VADVAVEAADVAAKVVAMAVAATTKKKVAVAQAVVVIN
jgi:hypothetical protein